MRFPLSAAVAALSLKNPVPPDTSNLDSDLLDAIIKRQSPGSGRQRPTLRDVRQSAASGPQLSVLEGHLRNAILYANARERLVKDAMATGVGRATAILFAHGEAKATIIGARPRAHYERALAEVLPAA